MLCCMLARWQGAKCTKNAPTHVLEAYRASFSTTQAHQVSYLFLGIIFHFMFMIIHVNILLILLLLLLAIVDCLGAI